MKQKRKYPYPFPHLEFACLFVKVFQGISGVLYYRFVSFKFHSLTTTFYVSLFTKSAQKILQRKIKFLFFYLLLRMISFWCSVSTRFFFGEGAIMTYSYRQEILTLNYIIMWLLFSGEMVTESITCILVMCILVTSIVVHVSLKWSAFPYRYQLTWSSSSNLDSGNFLLTCVLAGEFLGRPTFGERLIWMHEEITEK